ncbi:MAG: hypothetical protein EPO10_14555 [Reyranella sp.]|uniref:hypothetical protein n=1 Tax=Reyranella sp. TaxID=1929291 RepID=UPI001200EF21|nr:hypothetical protein [Reyranella sp.]TAJ97160.1 MAG: hypothetical protein EPO41_03980 [Reyranella sp.]TBR28137.1 MAG: hypothetical protein EPO10_14555 [Reyranella sp.]
MAWSEPIYTCHPDEATARAAASALGVEFLDNGSIPTGNQRYALCAPLVWSEEAPAPEEGFWSMLRINLEWEGAVAIMAAIEASGAKRNLANPPVIWA